MNPVEAKILKLSSGEEIVCGLDNNPEKSYLSVVYPMKIKATPKFNRSGDVHESLSLQRWIHFSDTDTYDVPKSQILTITNASIGLSKFYDFCVKRMKIEDKSLSYPTDEELDMIESEDEDIINEEDILESMGLVDISSDTMH